MSRLKLGTCMWGMPDKGLEGVKRAAELGFAGIAMDVSLCEREDPEEQAGRIAEFRRASERYGIVYPSMSVEILNETGLTHPLQSDKGRFAMERCRRGIGIAAALGACVLQLPSFQDGAIRSERDFAETCEKLRLLCEAAEGTGVMIASENALSLDMSLRMADEVGSKNFGILFDSQNYYLNGVENTPELFRGIARLVPQLHVKDGVDGIVSNALIGAGESGFYDTAEAIRESYRGEWILIETYYDRPPFADAGQDVYRLIRQDMETCRREFRCA